MSKLFLTLFGIILTILLITSPFNNAQAQSAGSVITQTTAPTEGRSADLAEAARLNSKAVELFSQARYDEALPMAQRALEIRGKYLRPDDNLVLTSQFNLAEILFAKKKYGDALALYKSLLSSYEQTIGPNDSRIAPVMDRLAFIYYERGEFDKTEASYKRALAIVERT